MTFREERYPDPASCIRAIRARIELGWHVVDISGRDRGPLAVVYGKSREDSALDSARGEGR